MENTLLIMAAGMGSRFGGLKQLEPVGARGEIIMDYSVLDAGKAGFSRAVFVIKKDFEKEFREIVGKRIEKIIDVDYSFQSIPPARTKPWGTGEAILSARDAVNTPFCVINADDFYGAGAYKAMGEQLKIGDTYSMVGYYLENTLTENGTVARGVCEIKNGFLAGITEHTAISKDNDFPKGTIVSMNLWGFMPNIFDYLEEEFAKFLKINGNDPKSEFFIPTVVDKLINQGKERVKVLTTADKWYGVTYKEDLAGVKRAIERFTKEGEY